MKTENSHISCRLSFVMVIRNDDYGGDFRERLQNCVRSLHAQLHAFAVPSEIVCVNYNPLPEPPIETFIDWPKESAHVQVKIITVPPQVHQEFVRTHDVKDVPVIEYLGKNVGIRRARGTYVACMNPDIIFPDAVIKKMARNLSQNRYYKTNRVDFNPADGHMEYVRFHTKGHSFPIKKYNGWLNTWWRIKYAFVNFYKYHSPKLKWVLDFLKTTVYYDNAEFRYHCMAAGDFMLMAKHRWLALEGYRENASISLHTDSLMVIQASQSGLMEKVFAAPVFHRDHGRRYNAEENKPEYVRAYEYFRDEAREMIRTKKNKIYNTQGWGLEGTELPTVTI